MRWRRACAAPNSRAASRAPPPSPARWARHSRTSATPGAAMPAAQEEGLVDVAFGLFGLALGDGNARTRGEGEHVMPARRRGDRLVGPASGGEQITTCQRDLRHALHVYRPLHHGVLHNCLATVAGGDNIAGGDGRDSQRRAGTELSYSSELGRSRDGGVGSGSRRAGITLIGQRVAPGPSGRGTYTSRRGLPRPRLPRRLIVPRPRPSPPA